MQRTRLSLALLLALSLASLAFASTPAMAGAYIASSPSNYSTDYGLVGYWKLDERNGTVANDSSGRGNSGTISGAVPNESGRVGRSCTFDGSDDYVQVAHNASLEPQSVSVSAWVSPNSDGTRHIVLAKWTGYTLEINSGGPPTFQIYNSQGQVGVTASSSVGWGDWHHLAGTFDNTTKIISIYIDGVNKGNNTLLSAINYSQAVLRISNTLYGGGAVNGSIDDVRIYNRSLSAQEIANIYSQRAYPTSSLYASPNNASDAGGHNNTFIYAWQRNGAPDAVLNMPFDSNVSSNSTGAVRDYSGYNNNGTLGNGSSSAAPTWISGGKAGGAYSFDGSNDFILLQSPFTMTDYTIELWFNMSPSSGWRTFLGYAPGTGSSWEFNLQNDDKVNVYTCNGLTSTTALVDGQWYHIAVTHTPSGTMLYINGALNNSNSYGACSMTGQTFQIGRWSTSQYLNGTVDQLMVYSRALSADEILAHYNLEYNRIASSELSQGDLWKVGITPNDASVDGATYYSSEITIMGSSGMGVNVTVANKTRWNQTQSGYVILTPQAGNITQVTHPASKQLTDRWAAFYGNVTGTVTLSRNSTAKIYQWTWSPVDSGGTVCLSSNAYFDFSSIAGANGTEIDTAWNFDLEASDNGNNTFRNGTCSVNLTQATATAAGRAKTGPSNPDDTFYTCPLKSPSDITVASGDRGKFAFCSPIIGATGKNYANQSADYEVMVPTPYAVGTSGNEIYYFYAYLD